MSEHTSNSSGHTTIIDTDTGENVAQINWHLTIKIESTKAITNQGIDRIILQPGQDFDRLIQQAIRDVIDSRSEPRT